MSKHVHEWTGLWTHFGEYGPQDKHFHVCFNRRCTNHIVVGEGRNCDSKQKHQQMKWTQKGWVPA